MAAASATRICRCASSQGRRSSARRRGRGRRCTHSSRSRSVSQPVSTTLLTWSTLHGQHYTRKVALNGVHFVGGVPGGDATGLVYQYYHQPQLLGLTPAGGACTRTHAAAAAAARASEAEPNPHLQLHPHPPHPTPPCCCRAPLVSPLTPAPRHTRSRSRLGLRRYVAARVGRHRAWPRLRPTRVQPIVPAGTYLLTTAC